MYEFISVLKKAYHHNNNNSILEAISEEEQIRVVKNAKWKSALSIFSKRNYSTYKYALESQNMTKIFPKFYTIIIRKVYYLKLQIKALDVILEKEKG